MFILATLMLAPPPPPPTPLQGGPFLSTPQTSKVSKTDLRQVSLTNHLQNSLQKLGVHHPLVP